MSCSAANGDRELNNALVFFLLVTKEAEVVVGMIGYLAWRL